MDWNAPMILKGLLPWLSRALALALSLFVPSAAATAATIDDCGFAGARFVCSYPPLAYRLRLPAAEAPVDRIPVVVIYHDAGSSADAIMRNDALVDAFLARGIAVLAPAAPPRKNRRLDYDGDRPGLVEAGAQIIDASYSERRFLVSSRDGGTKPIDWSTDTGWYFYTTDKMDYGGDATGQDDFDFIGRDEASALREVLDHAARENSTNRKPAAVIGVGHGGSLVWQFACYNPDLATLFAPVGGVFWQDIPGDCRGGANLLHTHERSSTLWPLDGRSGSKRRFTQTGVFANLEMLLRADGCNAAAKSGREVGPIGRLTLWDDCSQVNSVGMLLLDGPFAFQDWWLDEVIDRLPVSPGVAGDVKEEAVVEQGPIFRQAGDRSQFIRSGDTRQSRFKKPKYLP